MPAELPRQSSFTAAPPPVRVSSSDVVVHRSLPEPDAPPGLRRCGAGPRGCPGWGVLELEGQLGAPLADVLAGTAIGDGRLLLIDGAEAALEGCEGLLAAIATAALRAGLGVAAVTRADGARVVSQALAGAAGAAGLTAPVGEHVVSRLTAAEITQIAAAFSALARLAGEPRAAWLLGRPGLIDLLLRAGAAGDLPAGPLCEADVFAAIWGRLVRHAETAVGRAAAPGRGHECLEPGRQVRQRPSHGSGCRAAAHHRGLGAADPWRGATVGAARRATGMPGHDRRRGHRERAGTGGTPCCLR